ncbi:DUF4184 family protein [Microbacterium sp. NPDC058342]|uniref:DUF4184 family protein n=1 Tax=Microbacterium sp. NPDC058342 TaxID=3346454 RepID=UPI0036520C7D
MPFTPSHAVAALPFLRTPLVPGAIAIGAMTPDLPLFTRGIGLSYGFTHATTNIAWTTIVAFVLLLLWRVVLRPAFVELAPTALAARLPDDWRSTGRAAVRELVAPRERFGYPLLLVLSLMLGVLSHIAWDGLTHEGRWGVEALPVLQQMWGSMHGYKWLQHGSSALGLLVIGLFAFLWLRRRGIVFRGRVLPGWVRWAWYVSLPVFLIGAWLLGLAVYGPLADTFTIQHLAYRTLPVASGVWGLLTLLLCAVVVIAAGRARRRGER